ncbi:hypothetical protein D3C80_1121050 [compost metagenome]
MGADQWRAVATVEPACEQGCQRRLVAGCEHQRFLHGFAHLLRWPHLIMRQAPQHLVARRLRPLRMPIGAQAARRLWQHSKQCGFGRSQLQG